MANEEFLFRSIADKLAREHSQVTSGKMMSSPAITYKGKVFAFYQKQEMIFKLGREFDLAALDITNHRVLAPFKTKPPILDWLIISSNEQQKWEELARHALRQLSEKPDK